MTFSHAPPYLDIVLLLMALCLGALWVYCLSTAAKNREQGYKKLSRKHRKVR